MDLDVVSRPTVLEVEEPLPVAPTIDRADQQRELRTQALELPSSLESALTKDADAFKHFDALSSLQREKLLDIYEKLANNSDAQRDLITLLKRELSNGDDALTSHKTGGESLLDHLHALASETSSVGIYAQYQDRILSGLIHECCDSSNVVQGWVPSCVVTQEICHPLVQSNPAEYARLVREQALTGKMTLADGTVLEGRVSAESMREQSEIRLFAARAIDQYWESKQMMLSDEKRTIVDLSGLTREEAINFLVSRIDNGREERSYSGRIVQDALLGSNKWRGLLATETETLKESAFDTCIRRLDYWNDDADRSEASSEIKQSLQAGRAVSMAVLDDADGAHQISVVKCINHNGIDYVVVRDPRGASDENEKLSGPMKRTRILKDDSGEVHCAKDEWIVRMDVLVNALDRMYIDMGTGAEAQRYAGVIPPATATTGTTETLVPAIDFTEKKTEPLPTLIIDLLDSHFFEEGK